MVMKWLELKLKLSMEERELYTKLSKLSKKKESPFDIFKRKFKK